MIYREYLNTSNNTNMATLTIQYIIQINIMEINVLNFI